MPRRNGSRSGGSIPARHHEGWDLLRNPRLLDKSRTYVLYCAIGTESAHVAERLQAAGYEAYSFRHGVRGLLRDAQENGIRIPMLR